MIVIKKNDIFLLIKKKTKQYYFIFSINFNFKSGKIYML